MFPLPLIYRTQLAVILHVITAAQGCHVAPVLYTASLGPVRAHYPCFMCCSSSSPSCLTCTSGKLSTTSSTSATVERGMMGKARSETIILCFKHLRSLHFDRFIKTLSNVQNKLSGLENSIKDISSRHDSKVGFYAFKVLPAF